MAVGAVFVTLSLASGFGRLIWPALAAAIVGLIDLAGARLGVGVELAVFIAVSVSGAGLGFWVGRRRSRQPLKTQPTQRGAPRPESPRPPIRPAPPG